MNLDIEHLKLRYLIPLAVAFLSTLLSLLTGGPTFGFIDEGELAAVASTGGVAHPTGYPLLTMIGWVVTRLPFRDITELNTLAALLTGLGAGMLVIAFGTMLRYVRRDKDDAEGDGDQERDDALLSGVAAMMIVGCSIWWQQGTGFEVYALHALFLPTLVWLFVRWIEAIEDRNRSQAGGSTMHRASTAPASRHGFLFAVVLGLAFTNHMSTIFLAPAFLLFYAIRSGLTLSSLKRLLRLVPGFLLGLLPYLYIPIRAAADPRFNWSNAETWWAFTRHLSGAQYGVWMFTEPSSFALQSGYALPLIAGDLLWIGILAAAFGLWSLLANRKGKGVPLAVLGLTAGALLLLMNYSGDSVSGIVLPFLLIGVAIAGVTLRGAGRAKGDGTIGTRSSATGLFLLFIVLGTFLWSGGYSILDIGSYYLASLVGIGGLILFGLETLRGYLAPTPLIAGASLLAAAVIGMNYADSDRSDLWLVEDAATNLLESLPQDAVVISGLWDFWLSGSWYLQEVEGVRPDVAVIDHNLLKYSWYIDQLDNAHPDLMKSVAPEVAAFRAEQYKFERDLPYDAATIDRLYVAMIDRMIATSLERERPVLLTFDMNEAGASGMRYGAAWMPPARRVPWGLGYMIHPQGTYLPQEFPTWTFRERQGGPDGYEASLYQWYATAARDRAQYEAIHGNDSLARAYLEYGLRFDPGWGGEDLGGMAQGMARRVQEMNAGFAQMRQVLGSLR